MADYTGQERQQYQAPVGDGVNCFATDPPGGPTIDDGSGIELVQVEDLDGSHLLLT